MRGTSRGFQSAFVFLAILTSPTFAEAAKKTAGEADSGGPAYLLRYQFKKDQVLNYQVDHETTMTTTTAEHVEKHTTTSHSRKNQRVVGLDSAGNASLELMIEHAEMSAKFGDSKAKHFDSRDPENCPKQYRHMKGIIGQPLTRVQVSPRGKLLAIRPLLRPELLAQANLLKSDGSLSNEAAQNFLIKFPEEAITVGESWTDTFKVKVSVNRRLKQPMTLQRRYELVDVTEHLATIELRTALITPTRDGKILVQLIQMTPKGKIVFDMEKGRIVSRTLTVDKTEFGVIGGGGSVEAKSKRVERWIDPQSGKNAENDSDTNSDSAAE